MLPMNGPKSKKASGQAPRYLVVKLKRGWRYDNSRGVFLSSKGEELSPNKYLPRGSRIDYMVPELVRADPDSLSKDELDLVRYVNVILPKGADISKHLAVVQGWTCAEEARISPEISLPK